MSIRDRIQLVFRPPRESVVEPDVPPPHEPQHEVEFVAYAEDCRLFGHLVLGARRLTDMLNEHTEFELVDVAMEALADGRVVELTSMVVARDELLAVHATGPRGARERRHRTRPHPVAVQSGPYLVRGHLHAVPTADPFAAFRRRPGMVPLTEGSISYIVAGQRVLRRADTMIVNRTIIDWLVPASDEEIAFPDIPVVRGPLVKDFTGEIRDLAPATRAATNVEPTTSREPTALPTAAPVTVGRRAGVATRGLSNVG